MLESEMWLQEQHWHPATQSLPHHARQHRFLFVGLHNVLRALQCRQRHAQLCPAAVGFCNISGPGTSHGHAGGGPDCVQSNQHPVICKARWQPMHAYVTKKLNPRFSMGSKAAQESRRESREKDEGAFLASIHGILKGAALLHHGKDNLKCNSLGTTLARAHREYFVKTSGAQ
eukprot:1151583-Pelagomonas_calceolata.AAC.2